MNSDSVLRVDSVRARGPLLTRLSCAVWGHHVDNHLFRAAHDPDRVCRCGAPYLPRDGSATHVRHTLSCFLGHHTYERLTDRQGYHEYVCVQCGHPLLFAEGRDPYAKAALFDKKVRYLCGLVGHRVTHVTGRDGFVEYACFCGHSFLKRETHLSIVRHPTICVVAGHWIKYVGERAGYSEYVCKNCGHPFCFNGPQRRVEQPPS